MPNPKQTPTPVPGSHAKSEPTIRRTTISETGAITTKSVPLSALRRDAMDLSNNAPASLLLTREAAMRVTEGAITAAIANTWTNLIETERKKQLESSSKKQDENKMVASPNKEKSDSINHKTENKKVPEKSNTKASPSPPVTKEQPLPKNSEKPEQPTTARRTPLMSASKQNSQQSVAKTKSSSVTNDSKKKNLKSQKTSSATKNKDHPIMTTFPHQICLVFKPTIIACRTILSKARPPCDLSGLKRGFVRISSTYNSDKTVNNVNSRRVSYCQSCHQDKNVVFRLRHKFPSYSDISIREYASLPDIKQDDLQPIGKIKPVPLTLPQKFVKDFPPRFQPYLKLSRIDRPIGTWLLFWPSTWGLTVASGGIPDLSLLALFGAGAFVMRGAGCTVNDMWDRHIDPKVERTSDRPLASRQIRMRHATVWLGAQLSVAFGILLQLNPSCFLISCSALGLVCLYPLAKRVTYWPQAVLGLTFNTGVLIGFAAAHPTQTGLFDVPYLDVACLSLYFSGILWTLIYDTIYAHQDLKDDTLLGLGSTARRFGDNTKLWLTSFSGLMVTSLAVAGVSAELSWPYYLGLCGVSAHLFWQIQTLNIKDASNCGDRFTSNRHIGWLILVSILTSYWVKEREKQKSYPSKAIIDATESLSVTKFTSIASNNI
ncbi:4-hydroxybenzoate polyprenyltransferase, mitochondrial [Orchesella cincta]|uniref:4-hydroxybenzoate polyprenyltransferase, mitochondrial n=1 Tax=Orchesella cincta TaxID=48709 RepID=A0A1D2NKW7_ORCCI|nr:4-hydroxybenzoate polyprenyltransferase, mitochondrial [Orchesella cincta]